MIIYLFIGWTAAKPTRQETSLGRWDVPFKENPWIRKFEERIGKLNAELCFVPDVTIISADDDQHRLSSKFVDDIGLVRVNIPNKAFGRRILKDCKIDFRSLNPFVYFCIRFIMVKFVNAHMVFRIIHSFSEAGVVAEATSYYRLTQRGQTTP